MLSRHDEHRVGLRNGKDFNLGNFFVVLIDSISQTRISVYFNLEKGFLNQ